MFDFDCGEYSKKELRKISKALDTLDEFGLADEDMMFAVNQALEGEEDE